MAKTFTALVGALIALTCSSNAWAQTADSREPSPQQQIQKAKGSGPLAYGFINTDGSVKSGSGNFTASFNGSFYEIKITGVNYFYTSFGTGVTPVVPAVGYCTSGSVSNELTVSCFNAEGSSVPGAFAFVTY